MTEFAYAIQLEVLYAWYGRRYYAGRYQQMSRKGFYKSKRNLAQATIARRTA